jgi:hypothetical protein
MSLILSGTDGLSDVDGSAATPAIRGTDANTGIFFPAADTIAFAEGGAEVARFDSSGRLGLANTNPSKLLTIGTSTTANPTVRLNGSLTGGSDTYQYSFGLDDTADFAGIKLNYADRVSKGLQIFTAPGFSFPITFYTNSATQAMTLDTSGNLLVGTTSTPTATCKFAVFGSGSFTSALNSGTYTWYMGTDNNYYNFYDGGGTLKGYLTNSGTFTNTSDLAYKKDIADIQYGLADVLKMRSVFYRTKDYDEPQIGFIAQEMELIIPEVVSG